MSGFVDFNPVSAHHQIIYNSSTLTMAFKYNISALQHLSISVSQSSSLFLTIQSKKDRKIMNKNEYTEYDVIIILVLPSPTDDMITSAVNITSVMHEY